MEDKNERIENLLAMLLIHTMKGASVAEKALALSLAGFTNIEIADFLQTTSASINQSLYERRKRRSFGRSKKKI